MSTMVSHWDKRYLDLCDLVASWSRDPSTKVGAVIVRPDKTVASLGFNGLPRGVADTEDRLNNRQIKYAMTLHAEANAILASREDLTGCTLYVSPLHPCSNCAAQIIQAGIKRVVAKTTGTPERWQESFGLAQTMLAEAGVQVTIWHE